MFSAFEGMPSWEVTELEKNGYFVTGGKFFEDGVEKKHHCATMKLLHLAKIKEAVTKIRFS